MQKKNTTFNFRNLNISQVFLLELGEYYITNPGNPRTMMREINQNLPATVASPEKPFDRHVQLRKWVPIYWR